MKKRLGVIVNPIAGMGGRVGLKGTDTAEIVEQARSLGAVPEAPGRAVETLRQIVSALDNDIDVLAAPGEMGDDEARAAGMTPAVVGKAHGGPTTPGDTVDSARRMVDAGVDLLLFAGGDGTARNICEAIGDRLPVIGVPAGVKIHSAVYATTPRAAADLVARHLGRQPLPLRDAEVMDIDEDAFRGGAVSAKLYGFMKVPYESTLVQGVKAGRSGGDEASLDDIVFEMADRMQTDHLYVLGPGTTTRAVAAHLGVEKTLLGVDLVLEGKLIAADVTEAQILEAIEGRVARIVVTPIGGQGHVFGRGNQQISPAVIKKVGREGIVVIATPEKLASFSGAPLLVDTGDPEMDAMLTGYIRIITGFKREAVYKVSA